MHLLYILHLWGIGGNYLFVAPSLEIRELILVRQRGIREGADKQQTEDYIRATDLLFYDSKTRERGETRTHS